MPNPTHVKLEPKDWLAAFYVPETEISFTLFGYQTAGEHWRITERILNDHLIYFVVESACEGRVLNHANTIRVEPGSLLWIPPGLQHNFSVIPGMAPITVYYMRFQCIQGDVQLSCKEDFLLLHNAWELEAYIGRLYEEIQLSLPYRMMRIKSLLALIFTGAFRLRSQPTDPHRILNSAQRLKLIRFAQARRTQRLTPAMLAKEIRLSEDYFTRVFRRTFGIPPRKWILRERIRQSAQVLTESSLNVTEIAQQLGYRNVYLFSRQFKEVMGVSPTYFRKITAGQAMF